MKKKSKKGGTAKKEKQKEETPTDAEPEAPANAAADEPAPEAAIEDTAEEPLSPTQPPVSLSQQSKLRSSSFRQGPLSPTFPEGETAADIYRKQVARIDDLEKENKRLAKEASDAERRYKKAEEELADLQEADQDGSENSQIEKLVGYPYTWSVLYSSLIIFYRKQKSPPFKGKIRSSNQLRQNVMALPLLYP